MVPMWVSVCMVWCQYSGYSGTGMTAKFTTSAVHRSTFAITHKHIPVRRGTFLGSSRNGYLLNPLPGPKRTGQPHTEVVGLTLQAYTILGVFFLLCHWSSACPASARHLQQICLLDISWFPSLDHWYVILHKCFLSFQIGIVFLSCTNIQCNI